MDTNFESIPVSTNTIIAVTNFNVDMRKAYENTPFVHIQETTNNEKKIIEKGRRRHTKCEANIKNYKDGDIIGKSFGNLHEGVTKNTSLGKKSFFRNAVSIVMRIDGKKINFKISSSKLNKRVKFQITGCKVMKHAIMAIKNWYTIVKDKDVIEKFSNIISIIFTTVMVNVNIDLGFNINREKFDKYINDKTEYMSLLETSFGYTGLNIKVPIDSLKLNNVKSLKIFLDTALPYDENLWEESIVDYDEFLNLMVQKDREKWIAKKRYGSFLVFYSGKVIFSSFDYSLMKTDYERFMSIIDECKSEITENQV